MKHFLLPLAALVFASLACLQAPVPISVPSPPGATLAASPRATATLAPAPGAADQVPIGGGAPTPLPPGATLQAPATPTTLPTPTLADTPGEVLIYYTQAGDTLPVLAVRFGVTVADIGRPTPAPDQGLLPPGQILLIPDRLRGTSPSDKLIPDSELVYSANAASFDVASYVSQAGGFLAGYREFWAGQTRPAAEIVERVALENSINPRILLALLQYKSGWVLDPNPAPTTLETPMGYASARDHGLYHQLTWASNQLNIGYYGWRAGTLTDLTFPDGATLRLSPDLNAGTVALQFFLAHYHAGDAWVQAVSSGGFIALFNQMFGDPFRYAVEPLLPPGLTQPEMELPFQPGSVWSLTGGPHGPWERDGAWAALDFAPPAIEGGCAPSEAWVTAAAPALVVRSGEGAVVLDLDGDGHEQTGWALFYMHIASKDRVPVGTLLEQGDLIGHPSCEGGYATGTHVHLARKFNGEWIAADGPTPFVLGGWVAHNGSRGYLGSLTSGDRTVIACTCASPETQISR